MHINANTEESVIAVIFNAFEFFFIYVPFNKALAVKKIIPIKQNDHNNSYGRFSMVGV